MNQNVKNIVQIGLFVVVFGGAFILYQSGVASKFFSKQQVTINPAEKISTSTEQVPEVSTVASSSMELASSSTGKADVAKLVALKKPIAIEASKTQTSVPTSIPDNSDKKYLYVNAYPRSVNPGEKANISWYGIDVTSCTSSWGKPIDVNGNYSEVISESKEFSVVCKRSGGTVTGKVTVKTPKEVLPRSDGTLKVPKSVPYKQMAEISWNTLNTEYCAVTVSGKNQKIIFEERNKLSGSQMIGPVTENLSVSLSCVGIDGGNLIRSDFFNVTGVPVSTQTQVAESIDENQLIDSIDKIFKVVESHDLAYFEANKKFATHSFRITVGGNFGINVPENASLINLGIQDMIISHVSKYPIMRLDIVGVVDSFSILTELPSDVPSGQGHQQYCVDKNGVKTKGIFDNFDGWCKKF